METRLQDRYNYQNNKIQMACMVNRLASNLVTFESSP